MVTFVAGALDLTHELGRKQYAFLPGYLPPGPTPNVRSADWRDRFVRVRTSRVPRVRIQRFDASLAPSRDRAPYRPTQSRLRGKWHRHLLHTMDRAPNQ